MATRSRAYAEDAFVSVDVFEIDDHDLSTWEVIDPSDGEESDGYSFDETSDDDAVSKNDDAESLGSSPPSDLSMPSPTPVPISPQPHFAVMERAHVDDDVGIHGYDVNEDDDDDDGDYDVDDEVMRIWGDDRFGNPRMRKLGKRACPKLGMKSKKTLPCYYHNRPSLILGKHDSSVWKKKYVK